MDGGNTLTRAATGTGMRVIVAVPLSPSLVAVMVAEPTPAPVTSPAAVTLALVVSELVHATSRPVSACPAASWVVAVNCTVFPTTRLSAAGAMVTDATAESDGEVVSLHAVPSSSAAARSDHLVIRRVIIRVSFGSYRRCAATRSRGLVSLRVGLTV